MPVDMCGCVCAHAPPLISALEIKAKHYLHIRAMAFALDEERSEMESPPVPPH